MDGKSGVFPPLWLSLRPLRQSLILEAVDAEFSKPRNQSSGSQDQGSGSQDSGAVSLGFQVYRWYCEGEAYSYMGPTLGHLKPQGLI